jgi:hypothetical protein
MGAAYFANDLLAAMPLLLDVAPTSPDSHQANALQERRDSLLSADFLYQLDLKVYETILKNDFAY